MLQDGTTYVFGDHAPLQAIRDRYGNTVTITHEYGQRGNVTRVTSPNGRWLAFTYDTSSRISQVTDNIGRVVTYTYDANSNLATVTDPETHVTTYGYTVNLMTSIKDGRDITYLTNEYQNGRVSRQILAEPEDVYQFTYTLDGSGSITQTDVTDPRAHVTRLAFNRDHYIVSETQALGTSVERTLTTELYAGSNLVHATVDGLNRRTEYEYDDSGLLRTMTRLAGTPDAMATTFTYEPRYHQLATVRDALLHTWTREYDGDGYLIALIDPLNHRSTVTMSPAGQITDVTDPLQHVLHFDYLGGDLVGTTDPLGRTPRSSSTRAGAGSGPRTRRAMRPAGPWTS